MFANKKFLTFSIAGIAVLASLLSTGSRVQATQSVVPVGTKTEYTVAQIHHHHHGDRHPWDGMYNNRRQQLAREWERRQWQRYQRCIHSSYFVNPRYCDRILREPNPYRMPRYGMGF